MSGKRVALLGPRGTFSEAAAEAFFESPEPVLKGDLEEVFEAVSCGEAEAGIVPVENSLEGSVGLTLDLLLKTELKAAGEVVLDIRHSLMALPETEIGDIKEVISHPHALAQCKGFLRDLGVRTRNFPSTSGAAREIAEKGLKNTAAVAPGFAAKLYDLKVLKNDIQDEELNQTRFLIVAGEDSERTGRDKTSLVLAIKDRPGALHDLLSEFAKRDVNLTRIESRPSRRGLGDYLFYIDLEGHREDEAVEGALSGIKDKVKLLKVVGSYPGAGK